MVIVRAEVSSGLASLPSSHNRNRIRLASPSGSFAFQVVVTEANVVSLTPGLTANVTVGG